MLFCDQIEAFLYWSNQCVLVLECISNLPKGGVGQKLQPIALVSILTLILKIAKVARMQAGKPMKKWIHPWTAV